MSFRASREPGASRVRSTTVDRDLNSRHVGLGPRCAFWLIASLGLGLGCRVPAPTGPCLSDRECHADRICHEGRCRFVDDVERELSADAGAEGLAPELDAGLATAVPIAPAGNLGGTTMFMGDARHTGRLPFEGPRADVKPLWTYRTGSRIYASAVVTPRGDVVVGSLDQSLTAVTPEGALRFRFSGAGKFYASAVITGTGDIVAGSLDGTLVALNALGQVRWQHKLKDAIDTSPALAEDGRVFVAADGLYAFAPDGVLLFHYPVGAHVRSAPAVHPSGFVVFGTPQGKLFAISAQGTLLWQADAGANMDGGAAIADDGRIVIGTDLGHVLCFDPQGKLLWRYETGDDVRATPAIAFDGTAIVGSYDRTLYAISPSGSLKWRYETAGRIRSSARIDRAGRVYFGSQDDFVYGLSDAGQLIFRFNLGRDVDSSPVIDSRGTLLVGADDGSLYALR
jgi:outer membrane protein assembly factor BamB